MTTPRLSFCIPIYNFETFIGATLDSVLSNIGDEEGIEIVVLDGGSTDRTIEVMKQYCELYPQIRYIRQESKGGIDADLERSINESTGDYCWLLSGDDVLRPGSVKSALNWLDGTHDVYICQHTQCDLQLNFLYNYPIFDAASAICSNLSLDTDRLHYLSLAKNTESIFSFMSGLIIRKSTWISSRTPSQFIGSCWGHAARLFECARTQLNVCYVDEIWIDRRGDNDSFLDKGHVKRLAIAIDGYHDIANYYFGKTSLEARHIRRLVRSDLRFILFMHAKTLTRDAPLQESRQELDRLVLLNYSDSGLSCWLAKALYFSTPVTLYKCLRTVKRFFVGIKMQHPTSSI